MSVEWFQAMLIAVTSVGSASIALILSSLVSTRLRRPYSGMTADVRPELEPSVFLFDDRQLVDATGPARSLLEAIPVSGSDWSRLSAFIAPRFEGFAEAMRSLAHVGRIEMTARGDDDSQGRLRLVAENIEGLARITLLDRDTEGQGLLIDGLSLRALEDELEFARYALDNLPALVWRENEIGDVVWANRAYILRCGAFDDEGIGLAWPLPRLFPVAASREAGQTRIVLTADDQAEEWFDCSGVSEGQGHLCFALPADAAVRAERALRDFVHTLSKTFADLPIGLAVFDRKRQIQLFNPALIELTHLTSEFLLGRPTLHAFLDRLREEKMMPEPKDYRSWRMKMTELEQAAASGFHSETWTLSHGQTYRVTGRPHPDGAVAFLFEDITTDVAVTRRFRAELELGQAAFDQIGEAVAVFDGMGELVMSNAAYDRLWCVEPETALGRTTLLDSIAQWRRSGGEDGFWRDVQALIHVGAGNRALMGVLSLRGETLQCRFAQLPGGALIARFLQPQADLLLPPRRATVARPREVRQGR